MGLADAARDERADALTCSYGDEGRLVCGGVRVLRELARGGMARVHAATTPDGGDAVVKILERSAVHTGEVHALFARSAEIMASIGHPGVPRVLGFERRGGRSYLAMERLRGGTLHERVKHGGPLSGAALDALLRGLLDVVAHLHARGLLHGDVTPGNVMFRSGEARPVLVDFDGVCTQGEGALASLVMTPGYTAPEQRAGELTIAADLYGVGATVVFAATGTSPDRLLRRGRAMELELGEARISASTRAVIQRLVALDPRRRPAHARAALAALDARSSLSKMSKSSTVSTARVRAASRLLVAAVVVLVASTLVAGALAWLRAA